MTTSLLNAIRSGGSLATLFHNAVAQQHISSQVAFDTLPLGRLAKRLASDARDRLSQGVDKSPLQILRQCEAGCNACCHHAMVDVTPLEALIVADYLRQNNSSNQLEIIQERLRHNSDQKREMILKGRLPTQIPCALLNDDGLCGVYEVRPLVCAGVFSLSRQACIDAAAQPLNPLQEPPLDEPAKAWTMGVSGGLQRAIVDQGLDGNLYELQSAVLCALNSDDAVLRWLRGDDVFKECLCTDAHSFPRKKTRHLRIDPPENQDSRSKRNNKTAKTYRANQRKKTI